MGKLKFRSINAKILVIILGMMIVMSATIMYVVSLNIKDTLYSRVHEQLSDNTNTGLNLIDNMYPGYWKLEGDKLYKGDKLINNSTEIVDSIEKSINIPVSIFAKDTRISTNIMDKDNRILGTKAQENVVDTVLNKGDNYLGGIQINGEGYEAMYVPLKDINKKNVGMFVAAEETKFLDEELAQHMFSILIIVLIILVITIVVSTILTRRIVKKIKIVVESMIAIGQGDFTVRSDIKSGDETQLLADTQNKMVRELSILVLKINKICKELSLSSDTLAATSQETTATAEEVSKALNDISNTTAIQANETENGLNMSLDLSRNMQKISSVIAEIILIFNSATTLNVEGVKVIELLSKKTDQSNEASLKVNTAINEMDNSSQKISIIMDKISEIAQQTNLLSLNASIEAARAGDAGLGFAVVASEIRKLSEQSTAALKDIGNIINGIQVQSKKAVSEMNTTKIVIADQGKAVDETKKIFEEISKVISNLETEVDKIDALNQEMTSRKTEIVNAMEKISASAQQNSAAIQQISASSDEQVAGMEEVSKTAVQLNIIAQELNSEIKKFKV